MTRLLAIVTLSAASCAGSAPVVFGLASGDGTHSAQLEVRADGSWTWEGNAGGGLTQKGRIAGASFRQFRALLEAARFETVSPCAEPSAGEETIVLVDHERDRSIRYIRGCDELDEATARLADCLAAGRHRGDEAADACRVPR